ncbi:uncharacterized protein K460DRAFT_365903 [Cucurbitaria berberidis CBS 394.84]|uniref:Uncharacterized protein n=1 Tax=Cucurbitaria berberidis CBS 394.84 TaxID=1168544 RepID=A0A9P4L7F5_9PLEO|nr:uncharacterized protein K460DRAFT_365903 [Cucurbitaria berberidis CBS 394.84]KAF1844986.1 hypothetical protein K460DRAFT_365903 [Cucurbitaria berberidis CBS 394.84]
MSDLSPSIVVRLSTSSLVFDLSQPTPFTITLGLTLDYTAPITFRKIYTGLFDGKLLHEGGLTFTNAATGQHLPRNTIDICYRSDHEHCGPTWATRSDYVTLYPGREYVIERTINPVKVKFLSAGINGEKGDTRHEGLKWYGLWGFEDKARYQIGVSDAAVVKEWIEGSIWEILGWQILRGTPQMKRELIRYTVHDSGLFEIRRPDTDGSLNWP